MTDREKAIVMAYTGCVMLVGAKFQIFHNYVEEIMHRPVYTHEFADKFVMDEIKEKAKSDFLTICEETKSVTPQEPIIDKIFCIVYPLSIMSTSELEHKAIMQIAEILEPLYLPENEDGECDCGYAQRYRSKFCPDCGADMRGEDKE